MDQNKTPLEGRGNTGNRVGRYSLEVIGSLINKNKTFKEAWEEFLSLDIQYISYVTFLKYAKKISSSGDTNISKNYYKPSLYSENLKDSIIEFLKDKDYPSVAKAHKDFTEETKITISYSYFLLIIKENNITIKNRNNTKRRKVGRKKKSIELPLNVEDIRKNWHNLIVKTVQKTLKNKFNVTNVEDIQDMVQEVYIDLCKYYDPEKYDPEKATFTAFLSRICVNCVYRNKKKLRNEPSEKAFSLNEKQFNDDSSVVEKIDSLDNRVMYYSNTTEYPAFSSSTINSSYLLGPENRVSLSMFMSGLYDRLQQVDQEILSKNEKAIKLTDMVSYLEEGLTIRTISSIEGASTSKVCLYKRKLVDVYTAYKEENGISY